MEGSFTHPHGPMHYIETQHMQYEHPDLVPWLGDISLPIDPPLLSGSARFFKPTYNKGDKIIKVKLIGADAYVLSLKCWKNRGVLVWVNTNSDTINFNYHIRYEKKGVLQLTLQLNFWIALNTYNSLYLYNVNAKQQMHDLQSCNSPHIQCNSL